MDPDPMAYFRECGQRGGKRGGKSRSPAKIAAARANVAKALAAHMAKRKQETQTDG